MLHDGYRGKIVYKYLDGSPKEWYKRMMTTSERSKRLRENKIVRYAVSNNLIELTA